MEYAQRHRPTVVVLMAAACVALVAVWLVWARGPATIAAAATPLAAASPAAGAAPEWLGGQVQPLLNRFTVGQADAVSSLTWVKTTWGQYETAINGGGDKASARPVYVVVAHGKFTSEVGGSRPGGEKDEPIAVTTVVMTFDAASQKPSTIDALYEASSFHQATLGEMLPLTLPTASE